MGHKNHYYEFSDKSDYIKIKMYVHQKTLLRE